MDAHTGIVVGTDGSPKAARAVSWAAGEAARRRQSLRVVAVHHSLGSPVTIASDARAGHLQRYEQFLQAAREQVDAAHPGLDVRTVLRDGDTVKELAAESIDAAALVIGSRGRGGFSGLLVGSTSLRLTSHAQVPVFVVPDTPETERSGVTVGDDGSEHSEQALTVAFDQARLREVPLTVVRVVANAYWYGPDGAYGEWLKESIQKTKGALAERVAPWCEAFPDVEVTTTVQWGHPAEVLGRQTHKADLLVVGTRGRGRATSLLLGSISHNLLHHAMCPVAVVPHTA